MGRKKAFAECVAETSLKWEKMAEKRDVIKATSTIAKWWAIGTGLFLLFSRR